MPPLRLAIHGAAGRMGQRLISLSAADPSLKLAAALEAPANPRFGQDAGVIAGVGPLELPLVSELPEGIDVVVDFSVPASAVAIARACAERRLPLVTATTGLDAAQQQQVLDAARHTPLLWAPNMSLAVNLAMKLAEVAARALAHHPSGVDVEIIEQHHRYKEDAPSGTALRFGEIIAAAMGQARQVHGRSGRPGVRSREEIGYHAVRLGDNPGEHSVLFGLLGETVEISVRAASRDCYAHGALAAAKYLAGKPPGLYTMGSVLGL